jgi:type IV secretion system protein VirB10
MPFATRTPASAELPANHPAADARHSPVMVFDASGTPAVAAPAPGAAPPKRAKEAGGDIFAGGLTSSDSASASPMANAAMTIVQGTMIPAVLETAIDSDLPGYARAVVTRDVRSFDGSRLLVPRSSRLIGQYKSGLTAGQKRIYVMWTRLIRPDGVSVAIASPSTDYSGRSGLSGSVDGHFLQRFGSAMVMTVLGGLTGGSSLVLSGQSAASVAADRDSQRPPTIRVPIGQPIRVFVSRDLDFSTVTAETAQ